MSRRTAHAEGTVTSLPAAGGCHDATTGTQTFIFPEVKSADRGNLNPKVLKRSDGIKLCKQVYEI